MSALAALHAGRIAGSRWSRSATHAEILELALAAVQFARQPGLSIGWFDLRYAVDPDFPDDDSAFAARIGWTSETALDPERRAWADEFAKGFVAVAAQRADPHDVIGRLAEYDANITAQLFEWEASRAELAGVKLAAWLSLTEDERDGAMRAKLTRSADA